jgi:hypothetical protein
MERGDEALGSARHRHSVIARLDRATQYAVKAVLKTDGSGILDHPLARMMTADSGIAAASH